MLYVYRNSVGFFLISLNWIPQNRHFHRCMFSMPILIKYISEVDSPRRISQWLGYDNFTCAKDMFLNFTYISWLLMLKVKKACDLIFLGSKKMTETFPLCDDAGIFDLYYSKFTVKLLSLFWESKSFLLFLRKWKNTFIDYVLSSHLNGFNFFNYVLLWRIFNYMEKCRLSERNWSSRVKRTVFPDLS